MGQKALPLRRGINWASETISLRNMNAFRDDPDGVRDADLFGKWPLTLLVGRVRVRRERADRSAWQTRGLLPSCRWHLLGLVVGIPHCRLYPDAADAAPFPCSILLLTSPFVPESSVSLRGMSARRTATRCRR